MNSRLSSRWDTLITMVSSRLERVSPRLRKMLKMTLNTEKGMKETAIMRMYLTAYSISSGSTRG